MRLSAIAGTNPAVIRQTVCDLGDGTFAVNMHGWFGMDVYVRVDADLWAIETKAEGVEPMAGIGDEAVRGWITTGLLLIRKGDYEIDLGVIAIFADDATIKAAQQTLGKQVVARI